MQEIHRDCAVYIQHDPEASDQSHPLCCFEFSDAEIHNDKWDKVDGIARAELPSAQSLVETEG